MTTLVRSPLWAAVAALLVFTSAAAGAAPKTTRPGIPSRSGAFTACYDLTTGFPRFIAGWNRCHAGEARVAWSETGPVGPVGSQGAAGERGPTGDTGPVGPQGARGSQGAQGLQGDPGPAGVQGPQGLQGDPGPQGVQGDPGPQGIQGDPGPQGLQGAQGIQGVPGPSDSQVLAAVSGTSAAGLNAGQSYALTSTCPAGKKILSGGYTYSVSTLGQTDRVSVASNPSASDAWTVTVRLHQNLGAAVTISLSVYAVCTV